MWNKHLWNKISGKIIFCYPLNIGVWKCTLFNFLMWLIFDQTKKLWKSYKICQNFKGSFLPPRRRLKYWVDIVFRNARTNYIITCLHENKKEIWVE